MLLQIEGNLARISAIHRWTPSALSCDSTAVAITEGALGDDTDKWFGALDGEKEAFGSWGYRDSSFSLVSDREGGWRTARDHDGRKVCL